MIDYNDLAYKQLRIKYEKLQEKIKGWHDRIEDDISHLASILVPEITKVLK